MSIADMTRAILNFSKQMNIDFDATSLQQMSYTQLHEEYKKFRTNSNKKSANQQQNLGKDPKLMTERELLAQNLNGVNTSKLDGTKSKQIKRTPQKTNMPPARQADVEDDDDGPTNVVKLERRILHIRPKIKIEDVRTVNATEHIKNFIQRMRKADPLIRILPMDPGNSSAEDELESEKYYLIYKTE